jgi:hypothetical protein
MSTQDEQISDICDGIKAIRSDIAELPVAPDRASTRQIMDQLCPGEGLLAKLRPPPGIQRLQRSSKNRQSSGGEDDEDSSDDDLDVEADSVLDEDELDNPSAKGRLGEEKALEYLRILEDIIVSPSLLVGRRPSSDANGLSNHRQKDRRFNQ